MSTIYIYKIVIYEIILINLRSPATTSPAFSSKTIHPTHRFHLYICNTLEYLLLDRKSIRPSIRT